MCGRFCIAASPGEITDHFKVSVPSGFRPRYNIAPGQMILVITGSAAHMVEWGYHFNDQKRIINIRSETIHKHIIHTDIYTTHRCLIPASGYYEWKCERDQKIPYYFSSPSNPLFAFAGLLKQGGSVCQAVILTTKALPHYAEVHNRMPVLFSPSDAREYLAGGDIQPSVGLEMHQVSSRVNPVINDDPGLIEPVNEGYKQTRLEI
jgi:putative SOS response-associated peptidase YedK